ncbi:hypothetical protein [Actinomyces sp. oral taxon 414]|uniref:hypothetical protein n=1 Tax=Actinomyces sp. oral taxon 414 TaxID=712122 RepID=UPI000B16132A|nr:hypothetical protein [Actinomyces sp. oral taxon 414]
MRDMTEDLVGLVPPPEEPDPAGGGAPGSVVLSEDYLHFLSVYGVGTFDMFLHVMAPERSDGRASVRGRTASFWSVLARMSEFVPEAMAPLSDMLHAAASVAVWGSTDNGDLCLWVVPVGGEDGFVLIIGSRFEDWYEYGVGITEFLYRILTGDIRCPAFPEDFPSTGETPPSRDLTAIEDLFSTRHSFLTGDQYLRVMDAWPAPWKTIQEEQEKQAGAQSG